MKILKLIKYMLLLLTLNVLSAGLICDLYEPPTTYILAALFALAIINPIFYLWRKECENYE